MAALRYVILARLGVGRILTAGIFSLISIGLPRCYCECLGTKRLTSGMSECWYAIDSLLDLPFDQAIQTTGHLLLLTMGADMGSVPTGTSVLRS